MSGNAAPPRVVIVGGGFAGVAAAQGLRNAPVSVTLLDRRNHHVFQPLLYQVATSILAPGDVATPIRNLVRKQHNATVAMIEVTGVDTEKRQILVDYLDQGEQPFAYDYLILATGVDQSYFGHDEFAAFAPGLKSIDDAISVRSKVLRAFETAELERDPSKHRDLLTFILVGGGPTGVELAGALAEMMRTTLKSDFRRIDPTSARIVLVEGSPRILASFSEDLSRRAHQRLTHMGVEIRTGAHVERVDAEGVLVAGERIASRTVIWTAGVAPSPAGKWLATATDHAGRVRVQPDLTVPGRPEIFVVGDTASLDQDGRPLPGVAQVALQQGQYAAKVIANRLAGRPALPPFRYFDKGNMAVIGRNFAILESGRVRLAGFVAWVAWSAVHLAFLPLAGNRLMVYLRWAWTYVTKQRGSRLILGK
ncbi:MAG TPA: NAD(P)/FAD-dependent oxidoreductase [Candidatus Eisenbacteria bacterium]|nr:NAD(P)/FAD-dependent oxidoreductase [Candidatus Eisenbacteria bacterium]